MYVAHNSHVQDFPDALLPETTNRESMSDQTDHMDCGSTHHPCEDEMLAIREALQGLRHGQIVVMVQDGLVIQVDRTERRRLRPSANKILTEEQKCPSN
jgi:hypothetical protein